MPSGIVRSGGQYMDTRSLFSIQDRDEIESAAELAHITFDEYLSRCALWVVFNYPEVISKTPPGIDNRLRSVL